MKRIRKPKDTASRAAAALVAANLVDPAYYTHQTRLLRASDGDAAAQRTPERFATAAAAAEHFVEIGLAAGLQPNGFLDVAGQVARVGLDGVLADLADGSARLYPVRAPFDDSATIRLGRGITAHPGGPVGWYLQQAAQDISPLLLLDDKDEPWEFSAWHRWVAERADDAVAIAGSGLFEVEFYRLISGIDFPSVAAAIWHYVEVGETAGLDPHPLFTPEWWRGWHEYRPLRPMGGQELPSVERSLARYLESPGTPTSPHFDSVAYLEEHPDAAEHRGGPLGHFLARAASEPDLVPPRSVIEQIGELGPAPGWAELQARLTAAATAYADQQRQATPPPPAHASWAVLAMVAAGPLPKVTDPVALLIDGVEPERATWSWTREWRRISEILLGQWRAYVAIDPADAVSAADREAWRVLAEADERIVLVETSAMLSAEERLTELAAGADQPWAIRWSPRGEWRGDLLARLIAAAQGRDGAYSAVRTRTGLHGEFRTGPDALWHPARPLVGVLLRRDLLARPARDVGTARR